MKSDSEKSDRRVVLAEELDHRPRLVPSPDFGWYLLGWVGLVFTIVGGLDLLLTWYPMNFGNPDWEFGTVSAALDGLPVSTLGLALLLGAGVAQGRPWLVQTMAIVLIVLALVIVLAAFLYATNVPMALQAVREPVIRTGLKKAIVKTSVQSVVYPVTFVWLAVAAWRHTSRQ